MSHYNIRIVLAATVFIILATATMLIDFDKYAQEKTKVDFHYKYVCIDNVQYILGKQGTLGYMAPRLFQNGNAYPCEE